jgi:hypothetical protein
VSKFDSTSVQPLWPLNGRFVGSRFFSRVLPLRQRRSLISAQGWALATLGSEWIFPRSNSERVASSLVENQHNSFRVVSKQGKLLSQGFKANPGLKLANAVGVKAFRPAAIKTYWEEA